VVAARKAHAKEVFVLLAFSLGQQFQFDWGDAKTPSLAQTKLRIDAWQCVVWVANTLA